MRKGGRLRFVPLDTPQRTAALAFAQAVAGSEDAHLGNPLHSLKRNLRRFDEVMARFGVTANGLGATAHGLRHEALIDRYISKAGEAPPVRGGGPVPPEVDATAQTPRLRRRFPFIRPDDVTKVRPGLRIALDGTGMLRVEIDHDPMLVEPPLGEEFVEQLRGETYRHVVDE